MQEVPTPKGIEIFQVTETASIEAMTYTEPDGTSPFVFRIKLFGTDSDGFRLDHVTTIRHKSEPTRDAEYAAFDEKKAKRYYETAIKQIYQ